MIKSTSAFFLLSFTFCSGVLAQVMTKEDSLNNGISNEKQTMIGGYGEAMYQNNIKEETATANLTRAIIFVGHKFNDKVSFFSELEVEDAKSDGDGGEVSFEQCYVRFNLNKNSYITAGLFIPRIGIINENHLPTTFNGVERPVLETKLIPSTWRELGIGWWGSFSKVQGLNYSLAVVNGLNSAGFENGSGIREGRFEGRDASARNLAVTGSLLYYFNSFRIQCSGYYGGSVGLPPRQADSLQLESGTFGTPVMVGEANVSYSRNGFTFRGIFAAVNIPDAEEINLAYGSNTPEMMTGFYAEAGYNILKLCKKATEKNLTAFVRYENFDLNATIPVNGIDNPTLKQQYVIAGISYFPTRGVVVKADAKLVSTGEPNPVLQVNPFPQAQPYYSKNALINLGVGYSF